MTAPALNAPRNPYCRHPEHQGGNDQHRYCPYSAEQSIFHSAPEDELFFGGAAGPGKTIALLAEGARQRQNPHYRAIFFRRSYPELEQVQEYASELFPPEGAVYNSSQHIWAFPSGATYRLAYCERDADKLRYQGKAYQYIAWDELTQWPNDSVYTYLFTRCRELHQGSGVRCYIRAASNPGGPGHGWVFQRFIEDATPFVTRVITVANGRSYRRVYVPATLDSNDLLLLANNRLYETLLLSHPDPELRRALRFGDWSVAAGVLFAELRPELHRLPAQRPQRHTYKTIVLDWGFAHQACALWVESDSMLEGSRHRVYREFLENQTPPPVFAQHVIAHSEGDQGLRRAVLDPAAWATPQDGGPSPAEQMAPIFHRAGIALEPAPRETEKRSVKNQIALLHTYFWPHRAEGPLLQVMDNCKTLWRQLTTIVRAEPPNDIELPAKGQTDDALAALRYWAASRPEPPLPRAKDIMNAMLGRVAAKDPRTATVLTTQERMRRKRLLAARDVEPPLSGRRPKKRLPWELV